MSGTAYITGASSGIGLRLSERSGALATFGRGLVRAMPLVLTGLTVPVTPEGGEQARLAILAAGGVLV